MSEKKYPSDVVAERLGVKVITLRYWARQGWIPAGRSAGGARWLWSDDQIRQIAEMIESGAALATEPEAELCHA